MVPLLGFLCTASCHQQKILIDHIGTLPLPLNELKPCIQVSLVMVSRKKNKAFMLLSSKTSLDAMEPYSRARSPTNFLLLFINHLQAYKTAVPSV